MTSPVLRATRRLSGQLVATPLIGELRLPGFEVASTVRIKAECVQSTGSVWFRGYLHYLLVSLGRFKGVVLHGSPRVLAAQAWAASLHRLPMVRAVAADAAADSEVAELEGVGAPGCRALLAGFGVETVAGISTDGLAEQRGFHLLPGPEEPEVAAGLGSLGVELAAELPADVERVVLADPALVAAVADGFAVAERACEVSAAGSRDTGLEAVPAEWGAALAAGLRLVPDPPAAAALWAERSAAVPTCVVV